MPRTRAYRRRQRRVKLNRRYRILRELYGSEQVDYFEMARPQARHFHISCSCFNDDYGDRTLAKRTWRREWGL